MAIHIFKNSDNHFEAWTDCEPEMHHSGRCLGSGPTFDEARRAAVTELRDDLAAIERIVEDDCVLLDRRT